MLEVYKRANGQCESRLSPNCRRAPNSGHHRRLRKQQGKNTLENLMAVCSPCHQFIHRHPFDSYALGHLVHSWDDPGDILVITPADDYARHCPNGHEMTEETVYHSGDGSTRCRPCTRFKRSGTGEMPVPEYPYNPCGEVQ